MVGMGGLVWAMLGIITALWAQFRKCKDGFVREEIGLVEVEVNVDRNGGGLLGLGASCGGGSGEAIVPSNGHFRTHGWGQGGLL